MKNDEAGQMPETPENEPAPSTTENGDNIRASWNYSLDNIRKETAYMTAPARQALVDLFLWCVDAKHPHHQEDVVRRLGTSRSTLYKLYTGKYRLTRNEPKLDPPAALVKAIRDFIALERERHQGGKNEFVMTPTAKRIFTACDLARESQTPVFLLGPSHVGKTVSLLEYARTNNHGRTIYVRMKAVGGLGGMVRKIADSLGISDKSNTADLLRRIENALTPDMLLQLDELHQLQYTYRIGSFFACLEVLRELYDNTGCGMVLCGTKLLLSRMEENKNGEMIQLMRRGVHRVLLGEPTRGDVEAILKHWKLTMPVRKQTVTVKGVVEEPYEMLRQQARLSGLKAITERLRYGRKLADKRGATLDWSHVVEAHFLIASQSQNETSGGWE
jgi:DNA transposition AAA+ family ATPase